MEMTQVETTLSRLETRLRAFIEGDSTINGIPRKLHSLIMREMIQAMQGEMAIGHRQDDRDIQSRLAPDLYKIVLPSDQASLLVNHPQALDRLSRNLESFATQANLQMAGSPILQVVPHPSSKELHVLAEFSHKAVRATYTTELDRLHVANQRSAERLMPRGFVIVNGLATCPLTQSVTNIGTSLTNQLVLHSSDVSPVHAQIRFSTGRYEIFNLDTRRGTYVNGKAVTSQILNPGDVIHLAEIPLVFGQEAAGTIGYTQALPAEPPVLEVIQG